MSLRFDSCRQPLPGFDGGDPLMDAEFINMLGSVNRSDGSSRIENNILCPPTPGHGVPDVNRIQRIERQLDEYDNTPLIASSLYGQVQAQPYHQSPVCRQTNAAQSYDIPLSTPAQTAVDIAFSTSFSNNVKGVNNVAYNMYNTNHDAFLNAEYEPLLHEPMVGSVSDPPASLAQHTADMYDGGAAHQLTRQKSLQQLVPQQPVQQPVQLVQLPLPQQQAHQQPIHQQPIHQQPVHQQPVHQRSIQQFSHPVHLHGNQHQNGQLRTPAQTPTLSHFPHGEPAVHNQRQPQAFQQSFQQPFPQVANPQQETVLADIPGQFNFQIEHPGQQPSTFPINHLSHTHSQQPLLHHSVRVQNKVAKRKPKPKPKLKPRLKAKPKKKKDPPLQSLQSLQPQQSQSSKNRGPWQNGQPLSRNNVSQPLPVTSSIPTPSPQFMHTIPPQQHYRTPLRPNAVDSPTTIIMSAKPTEDRSVTRRASIQAAGNSPTPVQRVKSFTTLVSGGPSSSRPAMGVFVSQNGGATSSTPIDKVANETTTAPPPVKVRRKNQRPPKVTPAMSSAMSQFQVVLTANERKMKGEASPMMTVSQQQRQQSVVGPPQPPQNPSLLFASPRPVNQPQIGVLPNAGSDPYSKPRLMERETPVLGSPLNIIPNVIMDTPSSNEMMLEDLVDRETVEMLNHEASPALSRFQVFEDDSLDVPSVDSWSEIAKIGDSIRWDTMEEAGLLIGGDNGR